MVTFLNPSLRPIPMHKHKFRVYATQNSFSDKAAQKYIKDFSLSAEPVYTGSNIDDWIAEMLRKDGLGIIPYVNSARGGVYEHISALVSPRVIVKRSRNLVSNLEIIGEQSVNVAFDLYANKNIKLEDLDSKMQHTLFTHPMALLQTNAFLERYKIKVDLTKTDTATGLHKCAQQKDLALAIAMSGTTHPNTYLLAQNIQPNKHNTTRFVIAINKRHHWRDNLKQQTSCLNGRPIKNKRLFLYSTLNEKNNADLTITLNTLGLKVYRSTTIPSQSKSGRVFTPNARIIECKHNGKDQQIFNESFFAHITNQSENPLQGRLTFLGTAPRLMIKKTEKSFEFIRD